MNQNARREHNQLELAPEILRPSALPMYDLPHLQRHNDLLWRNIADRLLAAGITGVPPELERETPLPELWRDSHLLLAQTCGYPLVKVLGGVVQLVATPKYKAEGCREAFHRSFIIVRASDSANNLSDLRGKRCAVNSLDSNTGMNLLRASIAPVARSDDFFDVVTVTGSHFNSLYFVANSLADVAAIDCVTFAHLRSGAPELIKEVRVLESTRETPCLPFVTAASTDPATLKVLREVLFSVATDANLAATLSALLLNGFDLLPLETYEQILEIEATAVRLGYPQLG